MRELRHGEAEGRTQGSNSADQLPPIMQRRLLYQGSPPRPSRALALPRAPASTHPPGCSRKGRTSPVPTRQPPLPAHAPPPGQRSARPRPRPRTGSRPRPSPPLPARLRTAHEEPPPVNSRLRPPPRPASRLTGSQRTHVRCPRARLRFRLRLVQTVGPRPPARDDLTRTPP